MGNEIGIFDNTFNQLERSMQIATMKQEIISHNIANAKTPGFEPLTFDEELMRASRRVDRKEVILEDELADLSKNSLRYSSYVKLLSSKLNTLRTIAAQGRR